MMDEVEAALDGVDVLALMIDASEEFGLGDRKAIARAARFEGTRILLLNKVDAVPKAQLLPLISACAKEGNFAEVIPISALTGDGVELALEKFIEYLPLGEAQFPVDQVTDQPERFLAAEIVREKAMTATKQEVPHAIAVLVDSFDESARLIRIRATIYVERDAQKGIVIGHGGATLKRIGTAARKELEELLGAKLFLELHVKVERNWRDRPELVRQLDWRRQLERMSEE